MPTVPSDTSGQPKPRETTGIVSGPPPVDYRKLGGPDSTDTDALLAPAPPPQAGPPVDFRQLGAGRAPSAPSTLTDELMAVPSSGDTDTEKLLSGQEESDRLGQAAKFAVDKSPEEAQRVLRLAETSGLPEDLVERNTPEIEKFSRLEKFDAPSFAKSSPIISEWLSQSPNRTAATWRDLPHLERLEGGVEDYSILSSMYKALGSGVNSLFQSATQVPGFAYSLAKHSKWGKLAAPMIEDQGEGQFPVAQQVLGAADEVVKSTKYGRVVTDTIGGADWIFHGKDFDERARKYSVPEMSESLSENVGKGNYGKAGRIMAIQFVANAPQQAAIILGSLLGLGAPVLAGVGLVTAGGKFKEAQEAGKGEVASTIGSGLNGAIEAGFERLGTFGLLKTWEKALANKFGKAITKEVVKDFAKTMLHTVAGEGNEEFWTSAAQDLADYITGINPDALKGIGQRAVDAGIIGGVSGGLMTTPGGVLQAKFRSQAKHSALTKEFYEAIGETADGMEIRKNLPQAQKDIVEALVKDGPIEKIYVPVEAIDKYFEAENPVKVMSDVGAIESYEEAKVTGGHVAIPLSTWVEKFVGTPAYQGLSKDIKFSPTDLSVNEAKEHQERIQAEADTAEQTADSDFSEEEVQDRNEFEQKEIAAGVPADQARLNAENHLRIMRRLSRAAKMSPRAMAHIMRLSIQNEEQAQEKEAGPGVPQTEFAKPETLNTVVAAPEDASLDASTAKRAAPRGNYVNGHTQWEIGVSKKGLSKSEGGAKSPAGIAALKHIGALLETAFYDRVEQPLTGDRNIKAYHIFYAPLQVGDSVYAVRIKVRETNAGQKFYHSMTSEEVRPAVNLGETAEAAGRQAVGGPQQMSLAQFEELINAERKQFPLFQSALGIRYANEREYTYAEVLESAKRTGNDAEEAELGDHYGKTEPTFRLVDVPVGLLFRGGAEEIERPSDQLFIETNPEDEGWAQRFAKEYPSGSTAEPILIRRENGAIKIMDGRHRARAAFLRGEPTVKAFVASTEDAGILTLNQSALPAVTPQQSPIGFYSQVEAEVQKMDFKEMPAKDLANRIKNIQGIKAEELEALGLLDWLAARSEVKADEPFMVRDKTEGGAVIFLGTKEESDAQAKADPERFDVVPSDTRVRKDEVLAFIRNNGVKVEQVVLSDDFKNTEVPRLIPKSQGGVPLDTELSWDEGETQEPDDSYIESEADYYLTEYASEGSKDNEHGYFGESWGEHGEEVFRDELLDDKDYVLSYEKDEDGDPADNVKLEWDSGYPTGATGVNFGKGEAGKSRRKKFVEKLKEELHDKFQRQAEDAARERYWDDSDYQEVVYTESETGWELRGRHGDGDWYSSDTNKSYSGSIEEAQIKLSKDMIEKGVIETEEMRDARIAQEGSDEPVPGKRYTLPIGPTPPADVNTPAGTSKFKSYKVDGGTNYREVLLRLPDVSPAFDEGHFNQNNVLAHVRLTDRVDAEGRKTLFIEELQSDWHQKGRERGYQETLQEITELPEGFSLKQDEGGGAWSVRNKSGAAFTAGYGTPEYAKEAALQQLNDNAKQDAANAIPDAPFKNTDAWAALAMKRMIRLAVEQGYDAVAWAPAEVHTDRWGTDSVSWVKKPQDNDGKHFIVQNGSFDRSWMYGVSDGKDTIKKFDTREEAVTALENIVNKPYWLVGSVEQVGGNADGTDIETQARERGHLLERRGTRVTSKDELRKVIAETLNRERNERSLEALTESVWKQMQEKDSGVKAPRKEGFEFFYNNLLPKKVVPGILKKLDKNAKVEVAKIDTGKRIDSAEYNGPILTSEEIRAKVNELRDKKNGWQAEAPLTQLERLADVLASDATANFKTEAANYLGDTSAELIGGTITRKSEPKIQDVWEVVLTPEMKAKAKEGFSLFQDGPQNPRARIDIANQEAAVFLSKTKDASSIPHEMMHYYMIVLENLARLPEATPEIRALWAEALRVVGKQEGEKFTKEDHESLAEQWESYLLTGKAPTKTLQQMFDQFKAWLEAVYEKAKKLPTALTPEAKNFFDTLLTANQLVAEAQKAQEMAPLFNDLSQAGMGEAEAAKMAALIHEAKTAGENALAAKAIEEADRKNSKEYAERRELVLAQVDEEVSGQPVYIALSILQKGTFPDGTEVPAALAGLKLDRDALKEEFPGQMKSLPKPYVYAREGGIHPDMAAELLGFSSGAELISALTEAEKKEDLVNRLTDERMQQEHPSLLERGTLPVDAMKAIHNDKQDELYRKELEYLMSEHFAAFKKLARRIAARPPVATQIIKEQAKSAIDRKQVRETNPLLYQRAEAKAGKEAMDLYLKGDIAGAVEAKTRQRYNHALYRAAVEAREAADKAAEYASKFGKASVRERIGKAGSDYLEQIESILDRFDFRKSVSGKAIDKKNSLRDWVASQQEEGIAVDLPDNLLNESFRKNYKELTNAELAEVRETLENIEHLARLKNKLLGNQKIREIEEAETLLLSTAQAHHNLDKEPEDLSPGLKDKVIGGMSKFFASHTRMEFFFEFLDGGKAHGAFWNLLFQPFVEAENAESALAKNDTEALGKIFGEYSRKERAQWFTKKTFIKETVTKKFNGNVTHAIALSVALNWGNEYNRIALMEGYGWNEQQVMKILDLLSEKDVKTVNALWAHINTYWESARDLQKEMTGVAPEKVQGSPAAIRAGKLDGGYYPIKFNNDISYRQFQLDEKAALGEQFGHATRAMTRHGHLIERTNTGGKPLLLNLSVLSGHLAQVRHDVTHRRAVIDVSRLVNRPKVREAITAAAGRQMYRQLNPWLKGLAGDTPPDLVDGWEKILSHMRSGATVVNLGFKITSGLAQILGFSNTVNEIGLKYSTLGMRTANPFKMKENWAFITERSTMMQNRLDNYDRDVRDYVKKQSVVSGVDEAWFYHIGLMDLALSIPTWMGAYQKAMDGGLENVEKGDEKAAVEYADSVVRKTMAAGAAKDLSQVQRGGELKRLFTAFYSQLNLQFNQLQQSGQNYKLTGDLGKLSSSLLLVWFFQAVGDDLLKGRGPDDDEEWMPWLLRKTAFFPFQTVVVGRDIISALDRKIDTGRKTNFSPSPAFQAFEALIDAAVPAVVKPFSGEEYTRGDARNAVTAAGYALKLPTRQLWLTGEYLHDLMTGEEQPNNPAEAAWRALVTGKPKDK